MKDSKKKGKKDRAAKADHITPNEFCDYIAKKMDEAAYAEIMSTGESKRIWAEKREEYKKLFALSLDMLRGLYGEE